MFTISQFQWRSIRGDCLRRLLCAQRVSDRSFGNPPNRSWLNVWRSACTGAPAPVALTSTHRPARGRGLPAEARSVCSLVDEGPGDRSLTSTTGWEPVQGFPAGLTLTLEAMAAPRSLDEAAPALPFCLRLPAGFVAELVARETALLTGPISELVTELSGEDGRSMADESEPWAVPPALPVTPSAVPDP